MFEFSLKMDNLGGMWLEDLGVAWTNKVELTYKLLKVCKFNLCE